jgi:hypothetical protein
LKAGFDKALNKRFAIGNIKAIQSADGIVDANIDT